jgi:hypothetical protein
MTMTTTRPTHTVTPTAAELIAAALGHDGQRWATPDGVTLGELIDRHDGRIERQTGTGSGSWRAVFPDESAITVSGYAAWDIGYAGCWCWQGNGHENCTAGEG